MSFLVSTFCSGRVLGGSSRKQVMVFLADKASDDGSGIWCSKATIARETERSLSTVKRLLKNFEREGLLTVVGHRKNAHGYTVEYAINLHRISALPALKQANHVRDAKANLVQNKLAKQPQMNRQDGPARTPNHKQTIQEPPTREREEVPEILNYCFKLAWQAYPEDRKRNRGECAKQFKSAVALGAKPNDIIRAIQAYEQTSRGYTRSKVKFSDNWFKNMNWHQFIEQEALEENNITEAMKGSLDRCANWINEGSPLCATISPTQVRALIDAGRVTHHQLVRVGLDNLLEDPFGG